MSSSMLYTMGMALDRAAESGFAVHVLVEGAWLEGHVAASDGVGLVLESLDGQHAVVRTERIAAVKISAESPYKAPITDGQDDGDDDHDAVFVTVNGDAHDMPGQRHRL